jgi:parallel beta-helix repeat protein
VGTSTRPTIDASGVPVAFDAHNATGVIIENLEIEGAMHTTPCRSDACGRGIWAGSGLEVFGSYFTANAQAGISGVAPGAVIVDDQFVANGSPLEKGGIRAGIKMVAYGLVADSQFIDNLGQGIWCDLGCVGGTWTVVDNIVEGNAEGGIRYEISSAGALIEGNTVTGNDTLNRKGGQGGIQIVSSANAEVRDNTATGNDIVDIVVINDRRPPGVSNDTIESNTAGKIVGCTTGGVVCSGSRLP